MTLHGKIQNGVIVLDGGAELPEGAPVTVVVGHFPGPAPVAPPSARTPEEEHRRVMAIIDRIAALPIEGSREPFSGADHDKVLYGKP